MNSAGPKVRFTRDGPLGTVTLASPPLNLIGQQLISDLLAALDPGILDKRDLALLDGAGFQVRGADMAK